MTDKTPETTNDGRPPWEQYFMDMAVLAAKRSTCTRRAVGAVLVKNRQVLATGYNGAPSNVSHCSQLGCMREKLNVPSGERHELCRGIHAEQNAIIQAAYHGTSIKDSVLYCTNSPCSICAKMIINAGIKTVFYQSGYADDMAMDMLNEAGVDVQMI